MARKTLDRLVSLGKTIGLVAAATLLPVKNVNGEKLHIVYNDGTSGGSGSSMDLQHINGATETGADIKDTIWNSAPPQGIYGLQIVTSPYGIYLDGDSRPILSESKFHCYLIPENPNGVTNVSANSLSFSFTNKDASFSNRTWFGWVHMDSTDTASGTNWDSVFRIPPNVTNIALPDRKIIDQSTNSYVDVSCRFITNAVPTGITMNSPLEIMAKGQPGTTIIPQYRHDLTTGTWSDMTSYAQTVGVDSNSFNSTAYDSNAPSVTFSNLPMPDSDHGIYRLKTLKP